MSFSNSSEGSLLSSLEEWKDVTPVPNPQKSFYPFYVEMEPHYDQLMGYFRAIMNSGEESERAKTITNSVILNNPSNPCPFWYRRRVLESIGYNEKEELQFINSVLLDDSLKSYQLWFHRKWLVDNFKERPKGVELLKRIMIEDEKNFHAWSYSLWLAERWDMHREVFDLTTYFINLDSRNNSAWSARMKILEKSGRSLEEEMKFALDTFASDLTNESVCSYILCLSNKSDLLYNQAMTNITKLPETPNQLSLLLHLKNMKNDHTMDDEIYGKLIKIDTIHTNYWRMLKMNSKQFD